jgi:hypothetical protein
LKRETTKIRRENRCGGTIQTGHCEKNNGNGDHGVGSQLTGQTYWSAYNAVIEYLNYFRGKTQDNTLSSQWFGASAQANKRALDVAMKMTA